MLFFCFLAGTASASAPVKPVDDLRKSVLALDSAWNRAQNDLRQKKKDGVLQSWEHQDYAKFITYLSGRINDYCRQLRTAGGEEAVIGLPCPGDTSLPAEDGGSLAPSRAEQLAALDKKLTEALGEFDEQLLREEQRIASRIPAERESGGGFGSTGGGSGGGNGTRGVAGSTGQSGSRGTGSYGSGGSQSGQGGQASAGGAGAETEQPGTGGQSSGSTADSGTPSGSRGTGSYGTGGSQSGQGVQTSAGGAGAGTGQPGADDRQGGMQEIESGYDDIVARQLREAAEKETDPELKKKLWEEYRKYKEGIR